MIEAACNPQSRRPEVLRMAYNTAIPRDTEPFHHWFMDCAWPLLPGQNIRYSYALILVDSATRYPACYPLHSSSAKNV